MWSDEDEVYFRKIFLWCDMYNFWHTTFWKSLILSEFYIFLAEKYVLDRKLFASSCYYCGEFCLVWKKNKTKKYHQKWKKKSYEIDLVVQLNLHTTSFHCLRISTFSSFSFFQLWFAVRKSNGNKKNQTKAIYKQNIQQNSVQMKKKK